MVRRVLRSGIRLGLLVGVVFVIVKLLQSRRAAEVAPAYVAPPTSWPTRPEEPTAGPAPSAERVWVEPVGNVCPPGHPIKAKLSSKLFHLPGMFAYERCNPDRCYATEAGAVADGLTKAKR